MRLRPLFTWVMVLSLPLIGIACRGERSPQITTTTTQASSLPVTKLEPTQPMPVTTLETVQQPRATTTLTTVQQTLTDLKAEKTSEGIRINLPENILFDFDKSDIRPTAKPTLAKLTTLLRNYKTAPVSIYGYTDSKGSDDYNQALSDRRASAVRDFLVKNFSIDGSRLAAKGLGESKPVAPNTKPDGSDNPDGRQKNRRVEVIIHN